MARSLFVAGNWKMYKNIAQAKEFAEEFKLPQGVTIVGGKTGTTNQAGYCLVLYSKNENFCVKCTRKKLQKTEHMSYHFL